MNAMTDIWIVQDLLEKNTRDESEVWERKGLSIFG